VFIVTQEKGFAFEALVHEIGDCESFFLFCKSAAIHFARGAAGTLEFLDVTWTHRGLKIQNTV